MRHSNTIFMGSLIVLSIHGALSAFAKPTETDSSMAASSVNKPADDLKKTEPKFLKRQISSDFIIGTSEVEVKASPLEKWLLTDSKFSDLRKLNSTGGPSPLLVFGDGLAAGWKDGGLYREGQQFSFPNLVAHQIGLKNFKSPLFDLEHGNGTGYFIAQKGSNGPRWKEVTNNLATVTNTDIPELVGYSGEEVENLAMPRLDRAGIGGVLSPVQNGWVYDDDGRRWTDDMIFFWRLSPTIDKHKYTYWDMLNTTLKTKRPSIVLSVFGYDGWISQNVKNKHVKASWQQASSEIPPLAITVANKANDLGAKAVVFTIPNIRLLPYFNWFTQEKLNQFGAQITIKRNRDNVIGSEQITGDMIFLPTKNTESLFERAKQGGSFEFILEDSDVADAEEVIGGSTDLINARIKNEAFRNSVLVVDLASLYEKVFTGGFQTEDGFTITSGVDSNFFSADGLYPSQIGNAVIANETIKVLNKNYNVEIPLINVKEFAGFLQK